MIPTSRNSLEFSTNNSRINHEMGGRIEPLTLGLMYSSPLPGPRSTSAAGWYTFAEELKRPMAIVCGKKRRTLSEQGRKELLLRAVGILRSARRNWCLYMATSAEEEEEDDNEVGRGNFLVKN